MGHQEPLTNLTYKFVLFISNHTQELQHHNLVHEGNWLLGLLEGNQVQLVQKNNRPLQKDIPVQMVDNLELPNEVQGDMLTPQDMQPEL